MRAFTTSNSALPTASDFGDSGLGERTHRRAQRLTVSERIDAINETVASTEPQLRDSVPPAALPLVAVGLLATYRASMVERDLRDHVVAGLHKRGERELDWLRAPASLEWVELERFVALIDAIGDTLGVTELRSLVRRRIADPSGSSFYAPMLRSWARSFGASPGHMLRGAVHVWRAAFRNAGSLRAVDVRPGEVHLVIDGPLSAVHLRSPALSASLEGLALGVLDLAQPRPVFVEAELWSRRVPPSVVCRFGN